MAAARKSDDADERRRRPDACRPFEHLALGTRDWFSCSPPLLAEGGVPLLVHQHQPDTPLGRCRRRREHAAGVRRRIYPCRPGSAGASAGAVRHLRLRCPRRSTDSVSGYPSATAVTTSAVVPLGEATRRRRRLPLSPFRRAPCRALCAPSGRAYRCRLRPSFSCLRMRSPSSARLRTSSEASSSRARLCPPPSRSSLSLVRPLTSTIQLAYSD